MFHVVLVEPEIPPNTGNIIRLCANTGAVLHLIEPLGFPIDHAKMRRAGLDYHDIASLNIHADWTQFLQALPRWEDADVTRMFAMTTHGSRPLSACHFEPGTIFVFGPESRGLAPEFRNSFPEDRRIRLPMVPGNRSLNLSNAVAVTVYEAWRQNHFVGSN